MRIYKIINERSKADLTVKEYISYTNISKGTAFLGFLQIMIYMYGREEDRSNETVFIVKSPICAVWKVA